MKNAWTAFSRQAAFALLVGIALVTPAIGASRPVVIIPGIMGSKLCDRDNNVIWGDRNSYTATRIIALRLPASPAARDQSIHSCGLIETINIIPLLWEADVYTPLLNFLKSQGYKDEEIIRFDYDWRLSNFENATRLRDVVDKLGSQKVDILAHSMGGIIARIYIQQLNGEGKVNSLVMLSTPNKGSAMIFARLNEGFENWPSLDHS